MVYVLSILDNQKALNTFQTTTFKNGENSRSFQDLHRNLRTFQAKMGFKDFSSTPFP